MDKDEIKANVEEFNSTMRESTPLHEEFKTLINEVVGIRQLRYDEYMNSRQKLSDLSAKLAPTP